jgi:hypothetical protein
MTSHDRSCLELRAFSKPSTPFRVIQIRERLIRACLVEPLRSSIYNAVTHLWRRYCCCLERPVGLGVEVSAIQRETVALHHVCVVQRLVDEELVWEERGEVGGRIGCGCLEAEERTRV